MKNLVTCLLLFASALAADGAPRVLNDRRIHLGIKGSPEWDEFANDPPVEGRFDLRFEAEPNATDATLLIRQDDVKQEWRVELNGRRLGKLFLMEADLIHTLVVPPGTLHAGENLLSILPPKEKDDIVLNEIVLDSKPLRETIGGAVLQVRVTDLSGKALPSRITIVNQCGTLPPLIDALEKTEPLSVAVRPGVVYVGSGEARIGLPPGSYTVFASRGFEYGVAQASIEIAAGESRELRLQLRREVSTPGLVSCDSHVHTLTLSGHGDATLEERMLTLAGEGIEMPVATEHNLYANYSEPARRLGLSHWFTPVMGDEVTTSKGHFNIFPAKPGAPVVDAKRPDWPQLMAAIRATPDVQVIILNHPRSIHTEFRPFDRANFNEVTGDNKRGPDFTFDALEVLNSGAQQTDFMRVYRDWFALLNHGYRVTAIAGSDSHDVSRFIVGQGRTYIAVPDDDPGHIDIPAACDSLRRGHAFVSMGLLPLIKVQEQFGPGDLATGLPPQIDIEVKVLAPAWVSPTNLALYANGGQIHETQILPGSEHLQGSAPGEKAILRWKMSRPLHDVHLVAIATGPAVTAPFWAMTRPYQPTSSHWQGRAIGSTNPVWIDADGDGKFTSAREYARKLIEAQGNNGADLLRALADFDEAVSAQAASLCAGAGRNLTEPSFAALLKSAAPQVAAGFAKYLEGAAALNVGQTSSLP